MSRATALEIVVVARHFRGKRQRDPEIGRAAIEFTVSWKNADDRIRLAVEQDVAADDRRVGGEQVHPQPVSDHRNFLAAWLIFVPGERPSVCRLRAEDLEVWCRHGRHTKGPGLVSGRPGGRACGITHRRARLRGHRFEGLALLRPVDVVRGRDAVAQAARRLLPELDDALGLRVAHRLEQDAVHQAEDGGVRPKPEGDGQRREERESGAAPDDSPGIAEVLPRGVDDGSHVFSLVFRGRSSFRADRSIDETGHLMV